MGWKVMKCEGREQNGMDGMELNRIARIKWNEMKCNGMERN